MSTATDVKYGTCDECAAVCETLHETAGRWICARHNDEGSASLLLLAGFLPVVLIVVFLAHLLGAMTAAVQV